MSLPRNDGKSGLAIESRENGFAIVADRQNASALAALFLQYGITCEWRRNAEGGEEELRFLPDTNRSEVQQILDGYVTAKGS